MRNIWYVIKMREVIAQRAVNGSVDEVSDTMVKVDVLMPLIQRIPKQIVFDHMVVIQEIHLEVGAKVDQLKRLGGD